MPFRVVLDSSVVLAACLDPQIDAKADLAAGVFRVLREEGVRPAITESLRIEVDLKVHHRVGQILDALRTLQRDPPPLSLAHGPTVELLEPAFAKLRRMAEESAGALQLVETRIASSLDVSPVRTQGDWEAILARIALEVTNLKAEIERRHEALNLEILPRAGKTNHERLRSIVPTSDLEHVAVLAAVSEARNTNIIFVTLDGALHGRRDDIAKAAPRLTVTTPAYLARQIARVRGKS